MEILIQTITAFVGGGGLSWVFFYRLRRQREGSKLRKEEFDAVSEIVRQATLDLQHLSARIAELEAEKIKILEAMSALRKEKEDLNATIRRMVRNNNPKL